MVRFDGVDIAAMDRRQERDFRRAAQIVFQDPFSSLAPHLRIDEIVGAALRHIPGLPATERAMRVSRMLDAVGLAGYERRPPHQVSGGQRQPRSAAPRLGKECVSACVSRYSPVHFKKTPT